MRTFLELKRLASFSSGNLEKRQTKRSRRSRRLKRQPDFVEAADTNIQSIKIEKIV